jgi:hypothetical protein
LQDAELVTLGNPIPVEVLGSDRLRRDRFASYVDTAQRLGMKSLILLTTAKPDHGNEGYVYRLYHERSFVLLVLTYDDLAAVKSAEDLINCLKLKLIQLIKS